MKSCWAQVAVGIAVILSASVEAKSNTFIDVTGEEGTIDLIHDLMTSQRGESKGRQQHDKLNEPIEFGVGPDDARFYLPNTKQSPPAPSMNNEIPDPWNAQLSPRYLDSNIQQNDYLNEIPEDPKYYQKSMGGKYKMNTNGRVKYPGMEKLSDGYQNFLRKYPSQLYNDRGNRQYEGKYPNRLHQVDLNSNNYRLGKDPSLVEKQIKQQQSVANNRFKDPVPEGQQTPTHILATEIPADTKVNYMKMDGISAHEPSHINTHVSGNHYAPDQGPRFSDFTFTAIVAGCTTIAVFAVVGAGMCWYRLHKNQRATADTEYPAYGVTGPSKDISPGAADRKLAQSAHMYHYQHQKQQMIALDKSAGGERQGSASDVDTDEEGDDGDYTVYECPGLASTGEMEVKNPLFQDEPTPATPAKNKDDRQGSPEPQED